MRFKSNKVKINGQNAVTDIGWDVAITDAGMRELDDEGNKSLIRAVDRESGKMCTVTSAALLDGQGKKATLKVPEGAVKAILSAGRVSGDRPTAFSEFKLTPLP